jgi:hypothetical protein
MLTRLFNSFNQATYFYLNCQTFLLLQKGFQKELVACMLPPALPHGKRITEKKRLTRSCGYQSSNFKVYESNLKL